MRRLITSNPMTGKETYLNQNSDGSTFIENTQRFDGLLELNKQMNDDWRPGNMLGTQRHMQHIAEIPNVVYAHLIEKFGKPSENPKAWKQWLNDNENRAFRTGGGVV